METAHQLRTALVRERALRHKEYDDANPDVGMPPFWRSHVNGAMAELGYSKDDFDYDALILEG